MADSEISECGANQNDACTTSGSEKGTNVERFINNGEESLLNLAKTVQDLSGPGSTLRSLVKSVKHLEDEIKCLKRKPEDINEENGKKPRSDSSESTDSGELGTSSRTDIPPSQIDDIDDLLNQEKENEDCEEEETSLLDDLDQYFEVKTETGPNISEKKQTNKKQQQKTKKNWPQLSTEYLGNCRMKKSSKN